MINNIIREYRGFDSVGNKGWVYGDLVHNIKVTVDKDIPRVMVGGYEVYLDSIGQYTGLKDKKGNKIYHGDTLRVSCGGKISYETKVVWLEGYAGYYMDEGEGCYSLIPVEYVEVVGNVFEKEKKD